MQRNVESERGQEDRPQETLADGRRIWNKNTTTSQTPQQLRALHSKTVPRKPLLTGDASETTTTSSQTPQQLRALHSKTVPRKPLLTGDASETTTTSSQTPQQLRALHSKTVPRKPLLTGDASETKTQQHHHIRLHNSSELYTARPSPGNPCSRETHLKQKHNNIIISDPTTAQSSTQQDRPQETLAHGRRIWNKNTITSQTPQQLRALHSKTVPRKPLLTGDASKTKTQQHHHLRPHNSSELYTAGPSPGNPCSRETHLKQKHNNNIISDPTTAQSSTQQDRPQETLAHGRRIWNKNTTTSSSQIPQQLRALHSRTVPRKPLLTGDASETKIQQQHHLRLHNSSELYTAGPSPGNPCWRETHLKQKHNIISDSTTAQSSTQQDRPQETLAHGRRIWNKNTTTSSSQTPQQLRALHSRTVPRKPLLTGDASKTKTQHHLRLHNSSELYTARPSPGNPCSRETHLKQKHNNIIISDSTTAQSSTQQDRPQETLADRRRIWNKNTTSQTPQQLRALHSKTVPRKPLLTGDASETKTQHLRLHNSSELYTAGPSPGNPCSRETHLKQKHNNIIISDSTTAQSSTQQDRPQETLAHGRRIWNKNTTTSSSQTPQQLRALHSRTVPRKPLLTGDASETKTQHLRLHNSSELYTAGPSPGNPCWPETHLKQKHNISDSTTAQSSTQQDRPQETLAHGRRIWNKNTTTSSSQTPQQLRALHSRTVPRKPLLTGDASETKTQQHHHLRSHNSSELYTARPSPGNPCWPETHLKQKQHHHIRLHNSSELYTARPSPGNPCSRETHLKQKHNISDSTTAQSSTQQDRPQETLADRRRIWNKNTTSQTPQQLRALHSRTVPRKPLLTGDASETKTQQHHHLRLHNSSELYTAGPSPGNPCSRETHLKQKHNNIIISDPTTAQSSTQQDRPQETLAHGRRIWNKNTTTSSSQTP